MKCFKLAVGGAHSTGKSTFLARLQKELTEQGVAFETVGDLATKCPLPILRDHTIESTLWIVSRGISEEIAASYRSPIVLVDRPVADAWAYLKATGKEIDLTSAAGLTLQCAIQEWMRSYSLVYQSELDDSVAIVNEKGRDLDAAYRRTVAREMESAYTRYASEHRRLTRKSSDSELNVSKKMILEMLHNSQ